MFVWEIHFALPGPEDPIKKGSDSRCYSDVWIFVLRDYFDPRVLSMLYHETAVQQELRSHWPFDGDGVKGCQQLTWQVYWLCMVPYLWNLGMLHTGQQQWQHGNWNWKYGLKCRGQDSSAVKHTDIFPEDPSSLQLQVGNADSYCGHLHSCTYTHMQPYILHMIKKIIKLL